MKKHSRFQNSTKYSTESASALTNGEETTDSIISKMLSNLSCLVSDRSNVMKKSNTLFNERRENIKKKNIPAFSVQGKSRSVSVLQKKWWQSSKTFQKVNYVTCSLVLWNYTFGVICTKMLQIQKEICFKVNNFFYRSLKKKECRVYNFLYKSKSLLWTVYSSSFFHCHLNGFLKDTSLYLCRSASSFLLSLIFLITFP